MIGKTEEIVLLAAIKAGLGCTAADIYKQIAEAYSGRPPAFGAVFTTLQRMEKKGWVSVEVRDDDKGKERKHFQVQMEGRSALLEGIEVTQSLGGFRGALA